MSGVDSVKEFLTMVPKYLQDYDSASMYAISCLLISHSIGAVVFEQFLSLLSLTTSTEDVRVRTQHIPLFIDAIRHVNDLLVVNGCVVGIESIVVVTKFARPIETLVIKAVNSAAASTNLSRCAQLLLSALLSEDQMNKFNSETKSE